MVALPDALLRRLNPRRAVPGSWSSPGRQPVAALRKKLQGRFTYKEAIARGVESQVSPELLPLRRAAHALITDLSVEAMRSASPETLAAFSCMARCLDHELPLMAALVEARGLAEALHVAYLGLDLTLDAGRGGWTTAIYLLKERGGRSWKGETWLPVRNAVCAASEQDYGAARSRALELGQGAGALERAHLAYAFPDEPWADDALRACVADASLEPQTYAFLVSACRDPTLLREYLPRVPHAISRYATELAVSLPEADAVALLADALPGLLQKPAYGPLLKTPPRDVATALGYFKTPAAAQRLAAYAGNAVLSTVVAAYFQDNPELSEVLSEGATGKAGRALAERVLAQVELAESDDTTPLAGEERVPAVLRDKPWRARGRAREGIVLELSLLASAPERLELPSHARAVEEKLGGPLLDMSESELRAYRLLSQGSGPKSVDYEYHRVPGGNGWKYLRVPDELSLELWNAGRGFLAGGHLCFVVRHGLAALPGFLLDRRVAHLDYEGGDDFFAAISSLRSPRIAPLFARIAQRKKHRRAAQRWLQQNAELAALGLVPAALGAHGAARRDAEDVLAFLAQAGEGATVLAAAARYGEAAHDAIQALLNRDPLSVAAEPPKPPDFLRRDALPAVRLTRGERLPEPARDALLEMLSISTLEAPYAGLERVQAELEPTSTQALGANLLEQWLLAGGPGRHEWMLHAVAHLPSEASTRRLALLARDWARRDKAKAERACATLAAIGSDLALLHLGHMAETSRFNDLKQLLRQLLDEAAEARGLSRDQLEDRTVPDLGLAADGKLAVSFGPRSFVASLDPSLALVVRDEQGALLRSLPRKTKEDDATLAKAGIERLKTLREDALAIAARQIRRLERAMVGQRALSLQDFRTHVAGHPVVMHLARALIWLALDSGDERAFRISEDGTFSDVDDRSIELGGAAQVRVAHRLALGEEATRAWSSLIADYEILQPFEQLGRSVHRCSEQDRDKSSDSRVAGHVVEAARLLGLTEAHGFERQPGGVIDAFRRSLRARDGQLVEAELAISDGIELAYLAEGSQPQTLGALTLASGSFGALDPIAYSELVRALEALLV